jgi:phage/plasmid primase-like uncharacterized protein
LWGNSSEEYAKEELRAEIASWLLAVELGLPHDPENHASYAKDWVKNLKIDPKSIRDAIRDAEKITSYILAFQQEKELAADVQLENAASLEPEKTTNSATLGGAINLPLDSNAILNEPVEAKTQPSFPTYVITTDYYDIGHPKNILNEKPVVDVKVNFNGLGNTWAFHSNADNFMPIPERLNTVRTDVAIESNVVDLEKLKNPFGQGVADFSDLKSFSDSFQHTDLTRLTFDYINPELLAEMEKAFHAEVELRERMKAENKDYHIESRVLPPPLSILTSKELVDQVTIKSKDGDFISFYPNEDGVSARPDNAYSMFNLKNAFNYGFIDFGPSLNSEKMLNNFSKIFYADSYLTDKFKNEVKEAIAIGREKTPKPWFNLGDAELLDSKSSNVVAAIIGEFERAKLNAPESFTGSLELSGDFKRVTVSEHDPADVANLQKYRVRDIVKFYDISFYSDSHKNTVGQDINGQTRLITNLSDYYYNYLDSDVKSTKKQFDGLISDISKQYNNISGKNLDDLIQPTPVIGEKITFINVPFNEKDEAKAFGAKWNVEARSWFVPKGLDLSKFNKWLTVEQQEPKIDNKVSKSNITNKLYLDVPFNEKDEAKSLGAKFDFKFKKWFIAADCPDLKPFERWVTKDPPLTPQLSPTQEFKEFLRQRDFVIDTEPTMNGQIKRVPIVGGKPNSKDGAYQAYLTGKPNGWAQNFKTGEKFQWRYTGQALSTQQVEDNRVDFKEKLAQDERALQHKQAIAIEHAKDKLNANIENNSSILNQSSHPYLEKKGIKSVNGIFFEKAYGQVNLLIPAYNIPLKGEEPTLQTIQTITPSGQKFFAPGCPKTGAIFMVESDNIAKQFNTVYDKWEQDGKIPKKKPALLIAEGYATAKTLHDATGRSVVCAFDSGNLKEVGEKLRQAYPEATLIFCADNDNHLKTNVGLEKATEAANSVGGFISYPVFTDEKNSKFTDFNDLALLSDFDEFSKSQKKAFDKMINSINSGKVVPLGSNSELVICEQTNPSCANINSSDKQILNMK